MKLTMFDNWGDRIEVETLGNGDIEVHFEVEASGAVSMELSPGRASELIAMLRTARDEEERVSRIH